MKSAGEKHTQRACASELQAFRDEETKCSNIGEGNWEQVWKNDLNNFYNSFEMKKISQIELISYLFIFQFEE